MSTVGKLAVICVAGILLSGCISSIGGAGRRDGVNSSNMSSVAMPLPEKLAPYMKPGKLDAYSLSIIGAECESGKSPTVMREKFGLLSGNKVQLNEKIVSGCAYTFALSLGKADAAKQGLERVYFTNDSAEHRTSVTREQTKDAKIAVKILIFLTADGQMDLGISESTFDNGQAQSEVLPQQAPDCYKGDAKICEIEKLIANYTNDYRASSGLQALALDSKISFVSRDWSAKQASAGSISHDGFPNARQAIYMSEFKVPLDIYGENVASNFCGGKDAASAAREFVTQWWNSAPHRASMLGNFQTIGVGVAIDSQGQCFGTQLFK
jgi:uncharacterized protein YkwD